MNRVNAARLPQNTMCQQLVQSRDDLALGQARDSGESLVWSAGSYDGREIRQCARLEGKPVYARLYYIAYGGGKANGLHLPAAPATVSLRERPGLYERLERFFDEKRIATRPIVEHGR